MPLTHDQIRISKAHSKITMRKKLLALGYNMRMEQPRNDTERYHMKRWEICKKHVDEWLCSDHCAVRKPMDDMTLKELVTAVTQFSQVYNSYLKRIANA